MGSSFPVNNGDDVKFDDIHELKAAVDSGFVLFVVLNVNGHTDRLCFIGDRN